jgi:transcriptional regulator with XRE-family HTH domain
MHMTLGERVTQRRERLGWSQGQLARRADIEQSLLSRIESGATANPGINALKALAKALACSIDHLVGLYDDEPTLQMAGTAS